MNFDKKFITVYGPTASGKSSYALSLAKQLDGIIINADSVQLFKDLPLLTAMPSSQEQQEIPHFLYGFLEPNQQPNVIFWYDKVQKIINEHNNKKIIIVGGTGLYFKVFFEGISNIPKTEKAINTRVSELKNKYQEAFYQFVLEKDPLIKDVYHPNDYKRLERALCVFLQTGKSIISFFKSGKEGGFENDCYKIYLNPERSILRENIEKRFHEMLKNKVIEQVKYFFYLYGTKNNFFNYPVLNALGAKEIISFINAEFSYDEMVTLSIQKSHQYAKRQSTWFNNQFIHDVILEK